jgi:hypothetical protein
LTTLFEIELPFPAICQFQGAVILSEWSANRSRFRKIYADTLHEEGVSVNPSASGSVTSHWM